MKKKTASIVKKCHKCKLPAYRVFIDRDQREVCGNCLVK
jgi:hypothetical protein